jgi:hypothetical protein
MNNEKVEAGLASDLNRELGTTSDEMRLNWLEKNLSVWNLSVYKKRWSCVQLPYGEYTTYKTMREAIDAAMNGTWQD